MRSVADGHYRRKEEIEKPLSKIIGISCKKEFLWIEASLAVHSVEGIPFSVGVIRAGPKRDAFRR
jgi:hypothetical protein